MLRPLIVLVAVATALLVAPASAHACHWGDCPGSPPEDQPFDIDAFASLDDPRTGAHGDLVVGWSHAQRHEQFPARLVIDLPAGFELDLAGPRTNDLLANVVLTTAQGDGAPSDGTATVTDWNDVDGWPRNGVYRWKVTIRVQLLTIECPAFVERTAGGGFRLSFDVCEELVQLAQPANVSVLRFEATLLGRVAGRDFVTNPQTASPPPYQGFVELTARQANPLVPPDVDRDDFELEVVDRVPDQVGLSPASASRRVGAQHTLTATVSDTHAGGDTLPVQGAEVDFEAVSGPNAGPLCQDVATDAQGRASCTYAGGAAGDDSVRATATKHGVSAQASASVDWDEPRSVSLSPQAGSAFVGGSHSVTATVLDDDGSPLPGEAVAFEVTDGPHAGRTGSGTTDSGGRASFSYAGSAEGTDTIRASAGGASGTATVAWQPPPTVQPASIQLSPDRYISRRVGRDAAKFWAFVQDSKGRFMPGVRVRFSVVSGPNAGDFSAEVVTDQSGVARWEYVGTVENGTGTDTVEARVAGTGLADTSTVDWVPQTSCEDPQVSGSVTVCVKVG